MTTPVAIITASSQGMGAGIARELAARGYRVSLLGSIGPVVALAKELGGTAIQGSLQGPSTFSDSSLTRWKLTAGSTRS